MMQILIEMGKYKMKKELILLSLVMLLLPGCAVFKIYDSYYGTIIDEKEGQPIQGAVILVEYTTDALSLGGSSSNYIDTAEAVSDKQGRFKIPAKFLLTFRLLNIWSSYPYVYILKPGYGCFDNVGGITTVSKRGSGEYPPWWSIPAGTETVIKLPKTANLDERRRNSSCGPSLCIPDHEDDLWACGQWQSRVPFYKMRSFEKARYFEQVELGEAGRKFGRQFGIHGELYVAIWGNDYKQVKSLLAEGVDVNINQYTPLMCAAENGRLRIVGLLLSSSAHVNTPDNDGNTPLLLALKNQHVNVSHKLLDNNADINFANKGGITPLMYAAETGDLDLIKRLIKNGARIDARDKHGYTPVLYAVLHPDVLKLLIGKGADINDTQSGTTLLLQTLGLSRDSTITKKVFEILISSGINVNARAKNGETALMRAKNISERDIVTLLINNGADTSH